MRKEKFAPHLYPPPAEAAGGEEGGLGWMKGELELLKGQSLYRKLRVLEEIKGTRATVDGRKISLFCGNDYLGLSQHPKLIEAAKQALETSGVGTGSARLISGTQKRHVELEDRIARFFRREKALLFSSGYLANLGVLSALTQTGDTIILDKLCHASLIDAARLANAAVRVYPHKNLEYLEKILKRTPHLYPPPAKVVGGSEGGKIWIVTDSIFSMDGDLAPLPGLVELKNRYGAYLVIDEAHGTGIFGERGRGVAEHFGVSDEIDIHIGTLSKAIGSFGGFVTGCSELIDYLVNFARPFIFETALPASICAASIEAFDLLEHEPELRHRLWQNVKRLRSGLKQVGVPLLESESPIIPVVFGDEKKTLDAAERLLKEGFLIPAVRYPTVSKGKARLRVTVSAAHSEDQIGGLIETFKRLLSLAD